MTLDSVNMIDELSLDNVFSDEARWESSSSWSFSDTMLGMDGVVDDLGGGCISFENEEEDDDDDDDDEFNFVVVSLSTLEMPT